MFKTTLFGWIRHGLTTLGGMGITNGLFTEEEWTTVAGAVAAAAGVAWSMLDKYLAGRIGSPGLSR